MRIGLTSRPQVPAQVLDLSSQMVELCQELRVVPFGGAWCLALNEERAAWLENTLFHLIKRGEALTVGHRQELDLGEKLLGQRLRLNAAVVDQHGGRAFDQLVEPAMFEKKSDDHIIHK